MQDYLNALQDEYLYIYIYIWLISYHFGLLFGGSTIQDTSLIIIVCVMNTYLQ